MSSESTTILYEHTFVSLSTIPDYERYYEWLRTEHWILPPLGDARACSRCQRPLPTAKQGVFSTCYDCGFRFRASSVSAVHFVTYAAEGTKPYRLFIAAKLQSGQTPTFVDGAVLSVAAGLWTLLQREPVGVLVQGSGTVLAAVPSSAGLLARARARGHAEGFPTLTLADVLRADPARPKQTDVAGADERHQAASGKYTADAEAVADADVVLLDDLYTSGSTLADAARAVSEAGARSVSAVVYARRVFPDADLTWEPEPNAG